MIDNREAHCTTWYPNNIEEIESYLKDSTSDLYNRSLNFFVCPHAGWTYSGKVSGAVYSTLQYTDTAIFLATNHTGVGVPTSLYPKGTWKMPLGNIRIDETITNSILKSSKRIQADTEAHLYEHAIEVQIPFLQIINPNIQIVPIEMMDYSIETCNDISASIIHAIEDSNKTNPGKSFCIVASSDMSHCGARYGQVPPSNQTPDGYARTQDKIAINSMIQMRPKQLLDTVKSNNITMCGSGPAASVIQIAKEFGAKKGELVRYSTSSEITSLHSDLAVGYAGIRFL